MSFGGVMGGHKLSYDYEGHLGASNESCRLANGCDISYRVDS